MLPPNLGGVDSRCLLNQVLLHSGPEPVYISQTPGFPCMVMWLEAKTWHVIESNVHDFQVLSTNIFNSIYSMPSPHILLLENHKYIKLNWLTEGASSPNDWIGVHWPDRYILLSVTWVRNNFYLGKPLRNLSIMLVVNNNFISVAWQVILKSGQEHGLWGQIDLKLNPCSADIGYGNVSKFLHQSLWVSVLSSMKGDDNAHPRT